VVAANSQSKGRTGSVTIGGTTVTVTEAGQNAPAPPKNIHFRGGN